VDANQQKTLKRFATNLQTREEVGVNRIGSSWSGPPKTNIRRGKRSKKDEKKKRCQVIGRRGEILRGREGGQKQKLKMWGEIFIKTPGLGKGWGFKWGKRGALTITFHSTNRSHK